MHEKRPLYILCDLEGASGISPDNRNALIHGSDLWSEEGRRFITSDVRAVCEAANEFGIDRIVLNDSHDNGKREPNVLLRELPKNVHLVRRPYLPGKPRHRVHGEPFGIVIVGQHARYAGGGFAPHTIQSPPIGQVTLNGIEVGEIGLELALFMGAKLLAVVGERAAVDEAKALCPPVVGVPVKSLEDGWFPAAQETQPTIRGRVLEALRKRETMVGLHLEPPFSFSLRPADGYVFDPGRRVPLGWLSRYFFFRRGSGEIGESLATWKAKSIIGGLYVLHATRAFLAKRA